MERDGISGLPMGLAAFRRDEVSEADECVAKEGTSRACWKVAPAPIAPLDARASNPESRYKVT